MAVLRHGDKGDGGGEGGGGDGGGVAEGMVEGKVEACLSRENVATEKRRSCMLLTFCRTVTRRFFCARPCRSSSQCL